MGPHWSTNLLQGPWLRTIDCILQHFLPLELSSSLTSDGKGNSIPSIPLFKIYFCYRHCWQQLAALCLVPDPSSDIKSACIGAWPKDPS